MNISLATNSRSRTLVWLLLIVGAIFVGRLFYLQIIKHDFYAAQARAEHTTKFTIPAQRGVIYAKDGTSKPVPLVMNEPTYLVYADPRYVKDEKKVVDVLKRVAGGNTVEHFDDALDDKEKQYVVLAKQLSKQQADMVKKEKLSGIGMQESERRVYPEGALAAQLLGFVDADGKGQYGLENALNTRLSGIDGQWKSVTDVFGIPLSLGESDVQVPTKNGDNIVLNVDRNIQSYAERALKAGLDRAKATQGSVVIMDPMTGGMLAMANYPTYEPAKFSEVSNYGLFQNAVVSEPYEAGSVIKTLTMGVGLDKGVVTPDSTYNNSGCTAVADITICNAIRGDSIGSTSMKDVLRLSLNTGVVHVLRQLSGGDKQSITKQGRDALYDYFYNRYRMGQNTGIEQAGETPGRILSPEEEDGGMVRYSNMTFGQGMNVTMIQVAAAFSAAINGGNYYQPQLVGGVLEPNGKITKEQPKLVKQGTLSPTASANLRNMVAEARRKGIVGKDDKPGYTIGGKTGTSQIIDPKTGKYTDADSIGSYLGFGGDSTPRYVIMVQVKDAKIAGYQGTVAAAPIFTDISNWLLDYMKIQPTR